MSGSDLYQLAVVGAIEGARRLRFLKPEKWFARIFAGLAFYLSSHKRKRIEHNLRLAFGTTLDAAAYRALTREIFFAYWQELLTWAVPVSELSDGATVQGIEHLESALAGGKGVILWESNSFGSRIAGQAVLAARGYRLTQLHTYWHLGGLGAGKNLDSRILRDVIRPYFDRLEHERATEIIYLPTDSSLAFTRVLVSRLAANAVLCLAGEGRVGQKHVRLAFLGQWNIFASGVQSLAHLAGAPVLPFFCTPMPGGGYCLEILHPLEHSTPAESKQPDALLQLYARELEARIRAHPAWCRGWDRLSSN